MSNFPQFRYSMKDVRRAGEALAGVVPWNNEEEANNALHVFHVAHNWRDSHAYPMRRLRYDLANQLRSLGIKVSPVARLKRMPSIRRKLATIPGDLNQMNDLAGCRAILPGMSEVRAFIDRMRSDSAHELYREYPYIQQAKDDGYRCHHMVFKFRGRHQETQVYNGRRVEVQIRTQLQHTWATAVESVGSFRRENLKGGQGNENWLRLFKLMSAEFALEEGTASDTPEIRQQRIDEIVELERKLDAIDILSRLNQAFAYTENYVFNPKEKPEYFQIEYDRNTKRVTIKPYWGSRDATTSYDAAEIANERGSSNLKVVLVEVDEIENLRRAYPNFFGDVEAFKDRLQTLAPREEFDYSVPQQQRVTPRPREKPNYDWLHSYRRWK